MGKWTDFTKKTVPSDADEVMVYDAAAKVNKRMLFSGIWSWILGKVNERLKWTRAGIITGAASSVEEATADQKVVIPEDAKELFFWVCMYRNTTGSSNTQMPFSQYDTKYIGDAEMITGGYYYSPDYYACFRIRIDSYVVWVHKSWLKLVEGGKEIDNSSLIKVYVYYR